MPWTKDRYGQLKAGSMILQHSLNAGLTEAAIANADLEFGLLARVPDQGFTQDEWTLAKLWASARRGRGSEARAGDVSDRGAEEEKSGRGFALGRLRSWPIWKRMRLQPGRARRAPARR